MKRPLSAKPGYRAPIFQNSTDQLYQKQHSHKDLQIQHMKLTKMDFSINDFSKIMPKKIKLDKQRLYQQSLQLKQKINQLTQQNIKYKTKISILEKQRTKLTKTLDQSIQPHIKTNSRSKFTPNQSTIDRQSTILLNYKKKIHENQQQNQYLRQQNKNIKKMLKYTKIYQIQLQCKILLQQYHKLQQHLIQLNHQLTERNKYQKQAKQFKQYLQQQIQSNKSLKQQNLKFKQQFQLLQDKYQRQIQKNSQKQKKFIQNLNIEKKKFNNQLRVNDDLRKQIKTLKQTTQNTQNKKINNNTKTKTNLRQLLYNPYAKQQNKHHHQKKLQSKKKSTKKPSQQPKQPSQKHPSTQKPSHKIANSQQNKKKQHSQQIRNSTYSQIKQSLDQQQLQQPCFIMTNKSEQKQHKQDHKSHSIPKINSLEHHTTSPIKQQLHKSQKPQSKIQQQIIEQNSPRKIQSPQKKNIQLNKSKILEEDSHQEDQHQILYQKQKQKNKKNKKNKNKNKSNPNSYHHNKQILHQIKELLTYRMIAQQYPFQQLQKDLLQSQQQNASYQEIEAIVTALPFSLNSLYAKTFLQYVYQKTTINPTQQIPTQTLLKKFRKVIKDFKLISPKQKKQKYQKIIQMTCQYHHDLQKAFNKIKNHPNTVTQKNLIDMFQKLDLSHQLIQIILAELSLCSEDLNHLSIKDYFNKFYIQDSNIHQSYDNQFDNKTNKNTINNSKKLSKNNLKNQYDDNNDDDDGVHFIMNDQQSLSMKNQQYNRSSSHIISDDDHI